MPSPRPPADRPAADRPADRPPADPGRPTPREALAKASAAAAPKVAKAVEAATPKVEQAAASAGKLLGTLRDRAKETARQFSEGYGDSPDGEHDSGDTDARVQSTEATEGHEAGERRRPRPDRQQP